MWKEEQPPEEFCKKVFLEILQNSQENACARVPFLIKLQVSRNVSEYLFLQDTSGRLLPKFAKNVG